MPFRIVRNDITQMQVDVIVNTANEEPIYSTGTDTAVYEAAGAEELLAARRKIGQLAEGEAAVTPGFRLPAKYIIHAVSPCYIDGNSGEEEKLRSCYEKSLQLALEYGCKSIAFPLIATGSFGYPKSEGMEIALQVVHKFLMKEEMTIYLVVFDQESVRLSGLLYDEIEAFIDENYVVKQQLREYGEQENNDLVCSEFLSAEPTALNKLTENSAVQRSLDDILANVGETFQQMLFRLIKEKGREEVEVYKGACKDKKLFYKIRNNVHYQPTKHTVYAFAISLKLSLDETKDLLQTAGFAMSGSNQFDLIMTYVFERGIYDMYKIDCILYDFKEEHYFSCE